MELRMGTFTGFTIELKSAALFGAVALVLSFITGIASGNGLGYALFKSLVITLVFCVIGYGTVVVLRRFVPELIEALSPAAPEENAVDTAQPSAAESTGADGEAAKTRGDTEKKPDVRLEKEFEPLTSGDFKSFSSGPAPQDGKMGKHFVSEQKTVKYEPKIIAEAIRTMIHRDDKE